MNTLGVGSSYFAFAGKCGVYVRKLPVLNKSEEGDTDNSHDSVSVAKFPPDWLSKDAHIECIAISKDDKTIAVGDSNHGLYLFKLGSQEEKQDWELLYSGTSSKRVIKLQFTTNNRYLTFLDKQGDIYAFLVPQDKSSAPVIKKILGHTSFISDYVARTKSNQIVSCDRDEKIRVSNFPDAYVIQGFKLGHTESVISIAGLDVNLDNKSHTLLLSISLTGDVLMWGLENPSNGTETNFQHKWNVIDLLPEKPEDAGVKLMKATICSEKKIVLSVVLSGFSLVHIFEIFLDGFEMKYVLSLETESENALPEWAPPTENHCRLIVFTPELGCVRWFASGDISKTLRSDKLAELTPAETEDLKESAKTLKPLVVPMKKRQTKVTTFIEDHQPKKIKT